MRQTRITWFLVSIPLGLLFIIWGSLANPLPLIPGDVWLVLPGSILFVIGLLGILDDVLVDRRAAKFLVSDQADNKTLVELAHILNLDVIHLRELILGLRAREKLFKHFNSTTGFLVTIRMEDALVCPYCNHPDIEAVFCPVCGMDITNKEGE